MAMSFHFCYCHAGVSYPFLPLIYTSCCFHSQPLMHINAAHTHWWCTCAPSCEDEDKWQILIFCSAYRKQGMRHLFITIFQIMV
uniref:Uncharacterized protein n=1 Tax=Anguilla anguilla TaxID=7936 RepID=A0A0E9WIP4_ANGAN